MWIYYLFFVIILWGLSPFKINEWHETVSQLGLVAYGIIIFWKILMELQKKPEDKSGNLRTLWGDARRRLFKNKMAMMGLFFLSMIVILSYITPKIWSYESSIDQNTENIYSAPSLDHWMGTDKLGRDLLARIMWGSRISLMVGLISTLVSLFIGVAYGAAAGYFGGRLDQIMMRFVDIIYTLPYIFVVILLMIICRELFPNRPDLNLYCLFIALGLTQWLTTARIVRGQTLSLKEKEFVEAARCNGATHFQIIFSHIVPNLLGPVIVYATLTIPQVMLQEAFLSFIGLGVQAPAASWGSLASDGLAEINSVNIYWWLVLFPGFALTITLFSLNFLGDGLRDALDPQSKKSV
ncbi:MAG: ABC transporter permease [Planctomycetota bacterium]